MNDNEMPRRAYINKMTPEELEIYNLVGKIEMLGAHPLLTDVVVYLGKAREKLSDWVDARAANDGQEAINDSDEQLTNRREHMK